MNRQEINTLIEQRFCLRLSLPRWLFQMATARQGHGRNVGSYRQCTV